MMFGWLRFAAELRLALEALAHRVVGIEAGRDPLDRHVPVEDRVVGAEHLAHGPLAELADDLVPADLRGDQNRAHLTTHARPGRGSATPSGCTIMGAVPTPATSVFLASLKRCLAAPGFLAAFYDRFTGSSEEVREKFRGVDMQRQARVLEDSLYVVAVAVQGEEGSLARC